MTPHTSPLTLVGASEIQTSDESLLAAARAGRADAFAALHRRHHAMALRLARHLCGSTELAEEVTQDAFLDVWRAAHRFDPARAPFRGWLASIVRNRAIDAHRRAAARPRVVVSIEDRPIRVSEPAAPAPGVDDVVLPALARLPEAQRTAIFLAYFVGFTHVEVAAACQVPVGTVKGRIRLGLAKLRSALPDELAAHAA